jgi:hypothetical protein
MVAFAGAVAAAITSRGITLAGTADLGSDFVGGFGGVGSGTFGIVCSVFDGVFAIIDVGGFLAAAGAKWQQQKGEGEGAK